MKFTQQTQQFYQIINFLIISVIATAVATQPWHSGNPLHLHYHTICVYD